MIKLIIHNTTQAITALAQHPIRIQYFNVWLDYPRIHLQLIELYRTMLRCLNKIANDFVFVRPNTHRALETRYLTREARQYNKPIKEFQIVREGFDFANDQAGKDALLIVTGSHYTIGEILKSDNNT